jgi:response regulator RpfG family c-di-GMP phosphodiesterase
MANKLGVLILEDRRVDAELMLQELRQSDFEPEWHLVDNETDFAASLNPPPDLILADYSLPQWNALRALHLLQGRDLDIPFIVVTGTLEEAAIECMRQGADDYILKDRMGRLGPAVKNALADKRLRTDKARAEEAQRQALARIRRSRRLLLTLSQAAQAVQLAKGPEEIYGVIGEQVKRLGYRAAVFSVTDGGSQLAFMYQSRQGNLAAAAGIVDRILSGEVSLQIPKASFFGRILETGEPLYGEDIAHSMADILPEATLHEFPELAASLGTGQVIGAPLRVQEERHAILIIIGDDLSKEDVPAVSALANQASIALENARSFCQARTRLKQMQALFTVNQTITASLDLRLTLDVLLDQVAAQLGADAASVLLLSPNSTLLQRAARRGFETGALQHTDIHLGEGLAGEAALKREIIFVPNLIESIGDPHQAYPLAREGFVAYCAVPLAAKGRIKGVLEVFYRSASRLDAEARKFLEALATQAAIAIDNSSLFDELERSNVDLIRAYDSTLEGWARALELRDAETEGHSQRVTKTTVMIAQRMGISPDDLVHIRRGALLHDIGKMAIPDSIIFKPGPLEDEEWGVMRQHPVYAYKLLSPIEFLRPAIDIPYCHHEKWDGTGYPRGLRGEETPLGARIFALVDVWDALLSDRPYRDAWPRNKVMQHLSDQAGKHFDPRVVETFMSMNHSSGE